MFMDLHVTLCGSFHRDPSGLRSAFEDLQAHYGVLAPASVEFVDPNADFVRLEGEEAQSAREVESQHLEAIKASDFVWLFAPNGYVGRSAAMEIGYAHAVGVPVFTDAALEDETLRAFTVRVPDVAAVALHLERHVEPGKGVSALQTYYHRIAVRRGWDGEDERDTMILLLEELGEVARAIRKLKKLKRAGAYNDTEVGLELADVQLYLVHLANALNVNLGEAVTAKEAINAERARS